MSCGRRVTGGEIRDRLIAIRGLEMSIDMLRDAFLWCAVINYGVLLVWFLFFILARDFMHRLHGRWFQLSRQQFDIIHYAGMGIFKLGIILLNLVPYVA